jgi:2-polyprenyl-6-hydroxyphenyl methylase/3-demethylubiquinone-9 3-methyltransferase
MRNDLSIYEEHAADWWSTRSRWFRSLQSVNRFRLALLREWLGSRLRGATVVDLGCGGGLLAEPLAQDGAHVIGCDLSGESVMVAREHAAATHAARDGWPVPRYLRGDARRPPLRDRCADLVLLADVLEHLVDPRTVIAAAARLLRPGGHLFVNTIERSARARFLVVTVAEGLGLVPRGTHDPSMFIARHELIAWARERGLELVQSAGEELRLFRTMRTWTVQVRRSPRGPGMLYSLLFRTSGAAPGA